MSIIPSLYWEQECKCPNIKEKAHSRDVPKLKEGVNLIDFNKKWRKTLYLQNYQKEGNVKFYKPCWPKDTSSLVVLSKHLDSPGQYLNIVCEYAANIKCSLFTVSLEVLLIYMVIMLYGKKSEKKSVNSHFVVLTLNYLSQHCQ